MADTDTTTVLSAAEKADRIAQLENPLLVQAVNETLAKINGHNSNVALIKRAAAEKTDPKQLVHEARESAEKQAQSPELKQIMDRVNKLRNQEEDLIKLADKIAAKLVDKVASDDEITKAQASVKASSADIRESKSALSMLSTFAKIDLVSLLPEVESTRGIRVTTSDVGDVSRLRLKKILLNGEVIEKEVEVTKGGESVKEMRSTTAQLAQELTKRVKNGSVNATEITVAYLESMGLKPNEFDKVTAGVPHTFTFSKDVFDGEGKKIDTKSFELTFEK